MVWTKDVPTEPGYYWVRGSGAKRKAATKDATVVAVDHRKGERKLGLCVWVVGGGSGIPIASPQVSDVVAEWARIPEPVEGAGV